MSNYKVEIVNDVQELSVEIVSDKQAISAGINPATYIGPTGKTPELAIGTVEGGATASVTITGTPEHPVINLVLPIGPTGATPELVIGSITDGETASATITGTPEHPVLNLVLPIGPRGAIGNTGVGIVSYVRTSGTGAPGTNDIYTLTLTDGRTVLVPVHQGRDGEGTGDMLWEAFLARYGGSDTSTVKQADALTATATIPLSQVSGLVAALAAKLDATAIAGWAKQPSKPGYTAAEVGARPDTWTPTAGEVGADPAGTASGAVGAHDANGAAHSTLFAGKANTSHTQAASTITAGTLGGQVLANAAAQATLTTAQVRNIYAGTAELTPGTSPLGTGITYFMYE